MSLTYDSDTDRDELIEFLESEYKVGSGIPVHLYSVVNATIDCYNKMLAVTDNVRGVIFLEEPFSFKSYGNDDPLPLLRTLNQCGVGLRIL